MIEAMIDPVETRCRRAKALMYRKPICKDLSLLSISETLEEISEFTDNITWAFEDEKILNALNQNDDDEQEFRMMFADLGADAERMLNDIQEKYIPECFDIFFPAMDGDNELLGFDTYEQDYFTIEYPEMAVKYAKKQLSYLTKDQLIEAAGCCFRLYQSYMGLFNRYHNLRAALEILRDENQRHLEEVERISELYNEANEETHGQFYNWDPSVKRLQAACDRLPSSAWVM